MGCGALVGASSVVSTSESGDALPPFYPKVKIDGTHSARPKLFRGQREKIAPPSQDDVRDALTRLEDMVGEARAGKKTSWLFHASNSMLTPSDQIQTATKTRLLDDEDSLTLSVLQKKFQTSMKEAHVTKQPRPLIIAERNRILNSIVQLTAFEKDQLFKSPVVIFLGEEGTDQGGLLKEWADAVARALAHPEMHAEIFMIEDSGDGRLNGPYMISGMCDNRPRYIKRDGEGVLAFDETKQMWCLYAWLEYSMDGAPLYETPDIEGIPNGTAWQLASGSKEPPPTSTFLVMPKNFIQVADHGLMPKPIPEELDETQRFWSFVFYIGIGRFFGLCLSHGLPIPVTLNDVVLKLLLKQEVVPEDIEAIDQNFYKYRIGIVAKPGGLQELEALLMEPITFVSAATPLRPEPKDLVPGGSTRRVTEEDIEEYMRLLCQEYIFGDIQTEVKLLIAGFHDLVDATYLRKLGIGTVELSQLLCGLPSYNLLDWEAHTQCDAISGDQTKAWFFEFLQQSTEDLRGQVLNFVTGSTCVPAGGFKQLEPNFFLHVYTPLLEELGASLPLPQAHTCTNTLDIPKYADFEALHERLMRGLGWGEGFGLD